MPQASRRTVLRNAAWAVPVVTVSSTAPAFAASTLTDIAFRAGKSSIATDGDFFGVKFEGATLRVAPDAVSTPTQPTLTVTFTPSSGSNALFSDTTAPDGWRHEARNASVRNVLVFTYLPVSSAGATVAITDGVYFGTEDISQRGTFTLSFQVGAHVTQWSVSTGG